MESEARASQAPSRSVRKIEDRYVEVAAVYPETGTPTNEPLKLRPGTGPGDVTIDGVRQVAIADLRAGLDLIEEEQRS